MGTSRVCMARCLSLLPEHPSPCVALGGMRRVQGAKRAASALLCPVLSKRFRSRATNLQTTKDGQQPPLPFLTLPRSLHRGMEREGLRGSMIRRDPLTLTLSSGSSF